jgi:hypothetical protein
MDLKKAILGLALAGCLAGSEGSAAPPEGDAKTVPASLPPLTFESNRRISDYEQAHYWTHTFSSGGHSLVRRGDSLYAVWYDVRSGNADVYFAKSTDGGRTFGPNKKVNDDTTTSVQYKPGIGVDGDGIIYVAWRDGRKGNADIFFARSTDDGKTFSRNIQLNDDRGLAYQGNPTLAVGPKGVVAVAWSDARNEKDDIYMTVSRDQGRTFSANRRVNDDPETPAHSHPSVAVDGQGTIYAAWEDYRNDNSDIYLAKSLDGGATFTPNRKVNDDTGSAPQISPSLALGPSGEIVVAWADFRNSPVTLPPPHAAASEAMGGVAAGKRRHLPGPKPRRRENLFPECPVKRRYGKRGPGFSESVGQSPGGDRGGLGGFSKRGQRYLYHQEHGRRAHFRSEPARQ